MSDAVQKDGLGTPKGIDDQVIRNPGIASKVQTQQKSVMGGAAYGTVQKVDGSWEVVVEARMSDDRLGITLAEELIHLHQKTNGSYYGGQISSGAMNKSNSKTYGK